MSEPEILTVKECAELLRVSPWTIRRKIQAGEIKPLKLKGQIRIHRRALEKKLGFPNKFGYKQGYGAYQ